MADIVENPETSDAEAAAEENNVSKDVENYEKSARNDKNDEVVPHVPTKNGEVPAVDENKDDTTDGEEEKLRNRISSLEDEEKDDGNTRDVDVATEKLELPGKYVALLFLQRKGIPGVARNFVRIRRTSTK